VHELFFNSQGWPVVAPLRYAPLSLASPVVTDDVANGDVPGAYKYLDHGKDITATVRNSQAIRLNADGSVGGAVTGTWLHRGNDLIDLAIGGAMFSGVLSRQWNPNANRFVVTFSAQSDSGVSIWGVRTSD
jgi:arabinan endo-1,5-alpha-L-arabinosidase